MFPELLLALTASTQVCNWLMSLSRHCDPGLIHQTEQRLIGVSPCTAEGHLRCESTVAILIRYINELVSSLECTTMWLFLVEQECFWQHINHHIKESPFVDCVLTYVRARVWVSPTYISSPPSRCMEKKNMVERSNNSSKSCSKQQFYFYWSVLFCIFLFHILFWNDAHVYWFS